jgi:hypothetical protein
MCFAAAEIDLSPFIYYLAHDIRHDIRQGALSPPPY